MSKLAYCLVKYYLKRILKKNKIIAYNHTDNGIVRRLSDDFRYAAN